MRLPVLVVAGLIAAPALALAQNNSAPQAARPHQNQPAEAHRQHTDVSNEANHPDETAVKAERAPDWLDAPQYTREQLREKFDRDANGALDEREREQAHEFVKQRSRAHHEGLLKRFDADKDGKLSADEKSQARHPIRVEAEKRHGKLVARFDADGDGKLVGEEMARARAADPARVYEFDHFMRMRNWAERKRLAAEHVSDRSKQKGQDHNEAHDGNSTTEQRGDRPQKRTGKPNRNGPR